MGKPIGWYKPCGNCGTRHHVADGGLCMPCYVTRQEQIAFDAEAARLTAVAARDPTARAEGYAAARREAAEDLGHLETHLRCAIANNWRHGQDMPTDPRQHDLLERAMSCVLRLRDHTTTAGEEGDT